MFFVNILLYFFFGFKYEEKFEKFYLNKFEIIISFNLIKLFLIKLKFNLNYN